MYIDDEGRFYKPFQVRPRHAHGWLWLHAHGCMHMHIAHGLIISLGDTQGGTRSEREVAFYSAVFDPQGPKGYSHAAYPAPEGGPEPPADSLVARPRLEDAEGLKAFIPQFCELRSPGFYSGMHSGKRL